MIVPASMRERVVGCMLLAAACAYLIPFVPRGWVPHDEGMLGQSAERVMQGGLPHVNYEEAYTGGLSWTYAALFWWSGVDLLNVRWLLLAGAGAAIWLVYAMARRYLRPAPAALAAWVALVWSFPNYFAGLPSWWLLVCALLCLWALIRYDESKRIGDIALAGLAAGLAIAIKQTGLYVFVALGLVLMYHAGRIARIAAAAAAVAFAALMLMPRMLAAEGLYLFVPTAACALALVFHGARSSPAQAWPRPALAVAAVAAALPMLVVLMPYVRDHRVASFVNGAIVLPRKRLAFASMAMPPAWLMITGVPLVALLFFGRRLGVPRGAVTTSLIWLTAVALPVAALWHTATYQALWQSTRAFAALLPMAICWQLASHRPPDARDGTPLFAAATMLAWTSLNQFPFAAPIYFCYTAPLAVVAAVAAGGRAGSLRTQTLLPWAVMLLLFAVWSANRTYIHWLGVSHVPQRFDTPLALPRAHLILEEGDAATYRRLVEAIGRHLRGGRFVAGPDCPEVYFLAGLTSPSGALFDFLSARDEEEGAAWLKADVLVVNHMPDFSPRASEELLERLRRDLPNGEQIGRFEIRWR